MAKPNVKSEIEMKQLRGAKLEEFLVKELYSWFELTASSGKPIQYSQLAFANRIGVSRETIRKKQAVLDVVLERFSSQRKISDGKKSRKEELKRIEHLTNQLNLITAKYHRLKKHHVEIFSLLYRHGVDFRMLGLEELLDVESASADD